MNENLFKEFQDEIKNRILDYLPSEYENAQVEIRPVEKNNGLALQGICISKEGESMTPIIYLNHLFEEWRVEIITMEEVLNQIAELRSFYDKEINHEILHLDDFEKIKDSISGRLVNCEKNEHRLQNLPHTSFEDLAMTYHISINTHGIKGDVEINNRMLDLYGVDVKELHELAMQNMQNTHPYTFTPMKDIVKNIMKRGMIEDGMNETIAESMVESMVEGMASEMGMNGEMHVLTNEQGKYGAAALFYPGVKEMIAEQLGGDYYVLPSSLHEIIVLRASTELGMEELQSMVQDVNVTQVAPEERLSEHVYVYDAKEKIFSRADKKEEREEKRNMSFQEKLKEKKKESKAMEKAAVKTDKKKLEECL